jgi:hypothetical protein
MSDEEDLHIELDEDDSEIGGEPEEIFRDCKVIQHEHKHIDERPDSISIGTPSKGGEIKIYFNADDEEKTTENRIVKAFAARKIAQEQQELQAVKNV